MRKKRLLFLLLAIVVIIGAFAFIGRQAVGVSEARPEIASDASASERGAAAFVGAGFGGISQTALDSNAIPWKLAAAALVLEEQKKRPNAPTDQATLRNILKRYGFLYPDELMGIPQAIANPVGEKPLGMTHGNIAPVGGMRIEVANLGCASCHAGVAYDEQGQPTPKRAIPGMPNTSLDLEAYTLAIFIALRENIDDDRLLDTAQALFPEMGRRERLSLQFFVRPLAQSRLKELRGHDQPLPFSNGLPGATNGVASLKQQLGAPLLGGGRDDRGYVSIPELGERSQRSRLLADGAYAVPKNADDNVPALAAITSFFTVPSMGVHPDTARQHIGDAEDIFAWLGTYKPQPFPGIIDPVLAARGHKSYQAECASCHGSFTWDAASPQLSSFSDWTGDVGTDPLRSKAFDAALAQAIAETSYSKTITVKQGEGYSAPPLAGLWASAPYLHNGSVHSLAALLDPSIRMDRFMVGGHALDFNTLGLKLAQDGSYPAGYKPFSQPQWINTAEAGLGNAGHEYGSEMSPDERRALLEFLKML